MPSFQSGSTVHLVDVFEREVGRLVQEEKDKDGSKQVATGEYVSVGKVDGSSDVRGEKGNEEILTSAIVPCVHSPRSNWTLRPTKPASVES